MKPSTPSVSVYSAVATFMISCCHQTRASGDQLARTGGNDPTTGVLELDADRETQTPLTPRHSFHHAHALSAELGLGRLIISDGVERVFGSLDCPLARLREGDDVACPSEQDRHREDLWRVSESEWVP
jgi:hypothetical protein